MAGSNVFRVGTLELENGAPEMIYSIGNGFAKCKTLTYATAIELNNHVRF